MPHNIYSHQDIMNLEHHPRYPDRVLLVKLVRLGTLNTASISYNLLRQYIHPRSLSCKHLSTLENFCGFSTDLQQIRFLLLPVIQNSQALDDAAALALAALKSKARMMQESEKLYLKGIRTNCELHRRAVDFGETLFGIIEDVLKGAQAFNAFQASIPDLFDAIDELWNTTMEFGR